MIERWVAGLALAVMAGLMSPAPAIAGTCTAVAANLLPPGTNDANGMPLSPPIGDWYQIAAQCSPTCTTFRIQIPDCVPPCARGLLEWWAHAPAGCTSSTTTNPNDTLDCPCKPDGRVCIYARTSPTPTGGMVTPVHVTFIDSSPAFDDTPVLGGQAPACSLVSVTTTTVAASTTSTTLLGGGVPDFAFVAARVPVTGITNRGVTAAAPLDFPIFGRLPGFLNTAVNDAAGRQPNGLATFNAVDVATGDFNGDGLDDLATIGADGSGNRLVVFMSEGDGTFAFPLVGNLGTLVPTALAAADRDLDGRSDIAVAGQDCSGGPCVDAVLSIDGRFFDDFPGGVPTVNGTTVQRVTLAGPIGPPVAIQFGRFNADAIDDLVIAEAGTPGGFAVSLSDVTGTYGALVESAAGGNITAPAPRAIATGQSNVDVGGGSTDADIDIAVTLRNGTVAVIENGGGGTFPGPASTLAAGTSPAGVVLTDVSGDGTADVIAVNQGSGTVSTFVANSAGAGYQAGVSSGVGTNPISLATFEFNGDGKVDLAVVNGSAGASGSLSVLTGNAAGSFTPFVQFSSTSLLPVFAPTSVAAGRLDAISVTDDLAVANGTSGTFPNIPGGMTFLDAGLNYTPVVVRTFTAVSLAANLDGNGGTNDVAVIDQSTGVVFVLLNVAANSPPTVTALSIDDLFTASPATPTSATTFRDALTGLTDLAITDVSTPTNAGGVGQLIVGVNDGTGLFRDLGAFRQFIATPGATNILSGDFNGDGADDLVYIDFLSNFAAVTLNDGSNFFLTPQFRETGGFIPVSAAIADVNDDDNLDLVVAHQGSLLDHNQSVVTVLLGDGTGRLIPTGQLIQVPSSVLSITGGLSDLDASGIRRVVDFNHDGLPDFAVVSSRGAMDAFDGGYTPTVTLLLNRPDSPGTFTVSQPVPLIDDTATPPSLKLDDMAGGPGIVSGRNGDAGGSSLGQGGANYVLAVGDFNADGSPDLVVTGTQVPVFDFDGDGIPDPGAGVSPNLRAAIYLFGNDTASTVRVSRPIRRYTQPALPGVFDVGDTFVGCVTGNFDAFANKVPDVVHLSINGNLWIDGNATSVLNHAPIVNIDRHDLNAPFPGGGRKEIITSGQATSIPVTATDTDGDAVSFRLVPTPTGETPPSFVTLSDNGNGTAAVDIASADVNRGPAAITFRIAVEATDQPAGGGGRLPLTGRAYFTLVVNPNSPPTCGGSPSLRAAAQLVCDDGEPCTQDGCVEGQGCVFPLRTGAASASCICDRALPAACASDPLPKALRKLFQRACTLLRKAAATSKPKKAKSIVKHAAPLLKKTLATARSRKTKLSAGCKQDLAAFFTEAKQRADQVLRGGPPPTIPSTTTTTSSTTSTTVASRSTTSLTSTTSTTSTTNTLPCPASVTLGIRMAVNPASGRTSQLTWKVPLFGASCLTVPTIQVFDVATREPITPVLFGNTSHAESYAQDAISGSPVARMTLTNGTVGQLGGEREAVYAVLTWP